MGRYSAGGAQMISTSAWSPMAPPLSCFTSAAMDLVLPLHFQLPPTTNLPPVPRITVLVPGAIGVDKWSVNAFWEAWLSVPRTPNPMNRNTSAHRIQATYGASYRFGRQNSEKIVGKHEDDWPAPVQDAVAVAHAPRAAHYTTATQSMTLVS